MNTTENRLPTEVSTKTTNAPSVVQRVLWTGSLVAIGSVLAFHAALAYSPELARYVPELGIASSNSASTCQATPSAGGCCHARPILAADFAGCCSMDSPERPCLTDGLYSEDADSDAFAEAPADATECLPQAAPESATPADAADPA